jgi:hypothetical protein
VVLLNFGALFFGLFFGVCLHPFFAKRGRFRWRTYQDIAELPTVQTSALVLNKT